jgi:hypothetical protein
MTNHSGAPINSLRYADNFPEGYGDFAFQSGDGVIFHFPQFLLSFVSPVFKDMYEMGHNTANGEILKLAEDAETLDLLLQFIDPTKVPPPLIWKAVRKLLDAADKYQINCILSWFQREVEVEALKNNTIGNPLVCFELADQFKLTNLINLAACDLIKYPTAELIFNPTVNAQLVGHIYQLRAERTRCLVMAIRDIDSYSSEQLANVVCHVHGEARFRSSLGVAVDIVFETPSWKALKEYVEFCTEEAECVCEQHAIPPKLEPIMLDLEAKIPAL